MASSHPFPFGGHVIPPELLATKGHLAVCGEGGSRDVIPSRQPTGIPPEAVAKKLRQRGWQATANGKNLKCPACTGFGVKRPTGGRTIPLASVWSIPCEARDHRQTNGCCRRGLTLELNRKWQRRDDGSPIVPDSEVERQAKKAGWEVLQERGLFCPEHRKAFTALGAVVAAAIDTPKAISELMKPDRHGRGATEEEAKRLLRDAMEQADRVWGKEHVVEAIGKAQAHHERQQQQRKDDDMAAAEQARASARGPGLTEPTREQKRAINARLGEVHNGEGYADAWTDEKLGAELNVPRKWVADIREEFHGPAINEAAARERAKLVHELHRDMKTAKSTLAGLLDKVAAAETTLKGLETRLAAVEA